MALISMQDVSLGFGGPLLLEEINLQVEHGESLGLLGRNGMGKTTLLKLLSGAISPDSGSIARQQNMRLAYLPQEVPQGIGGLVTDIIAGGLDRIPLSPEEEEAPWQRQLQIENILSRMQLNPQAAFDTLSAGMKRRVLLARGLVSNPDLLLLDEPTNHLDIESIQWLEEFLNRWGGTLLFVTHDRVFLQKMAKRIIELDRGRLFDWNCDYPTFIKRKDAMLESEQIQNALFDKKLAQEEAWIRRGLEARRTRNEGRVRALQRLRNIRRERREQQGKVNMQIQADRRSGRLVIEAENVSYDYDDAPVLRDFSTIIQRGDRVGILGPNGTGKTTMLRLLVDELSPDKGSLRMGVNLEIAYFDQLRSQLDENKSVLDNVGQGRDVITINGKDRNIISYLQNFLFEPDRINAPISALSGGERNRLLLARLFAHPANLLILDEPTNDLDIETLEVLENLLLDYKGTLLLVTHDRAFLNNLVTRLLVLDGDGNVTEFAGNYDDWQRYSQAQAEENAPTSKRKPAERTEDKKTTKNGSRKLSYNEKRALEAQQRELAALPERIEALENEQQQLVAAMASPEFYQRPEAQITADANRMKQLEDQLAEAYQRWEELESL
jgi:ABC transport system ATP-binding/permease protein